MTRQLLLMRHAKSDWNAPNLSDKDRPLNARGRSTAPIMATWLFEQGHVPDLILCSSAIRTQQTLELVIGQWEMLRVANPTLVVPETIMENRLYLASDSAILSFACDMSKKIVNAQSLMVLGHNPGMEVLASILSGTTMAMPTASIAILSSKATPEEWPADWGNAKMWDWRGLVKPRKLGRETI